MALEHGKPSILILSGDRVDRRALFDALDEDSCEAIYTAKDLSQAQIFIDQGTRVDVIFLDLGEADGSWPSFFENLKRAGRTTELLVIGVMPTSKPAQGWTWDQLPLGVVECIRSPIQPGEATARMREWLGVRSDPAIAGHNDQIFAQIFEGSSDEILIVAPASMTILAANPIARERAPDSAIRLVGSPFSDIDLDHSAAERRALLRQLEENGEITFECLKAGPRGQSYSVEVRARLGIFQDANAYVFVMRDVSFQRDLESAIEVLASSFDGGFEARASQRLVEQLSAWLKLDYLSVAAQKNAETLETLVTFIAKDLNEIDSDPRKRHGVARVLRGEAVLVADGAYEMPSEDALLTDERIRSYVGLPLLSSQRKVMGVLIAASRRPIRAWQVAVRALKVVASRFATETELQVLRTDSREIGLHDPLTKLPNRMLFNDRLETALREAQRSGEIFAVMFVDLDRFKNINDTLGHAIGDQVLLGVAQRLQQTLRKSDTVARYAGDEFTMILRNVNEKDSVFKIAEKVIRVLEQPIAVADSRELSITASIGISFHPEDGITADKLVKHADVAMYAAKGMGRNNFQTYVAVAEESQQQRLVLESKLRHAERNNELRVFYQPQVDAESEDIVGMEALVRWEHPELGLISPGFFIPLAEETGLIVSMGEWVLREACTQAKLWQDQFGLNLRLGVNLSPLQIRQLDLVGLVERVLNECEYPPALLELEVTESMDVRSIPNLLEVLQGLRALGLGISIDDFGTGQSSLDYIKRFPADRIKIDQSFVRNIGVDPDDEAIVDATISMAHNLHRAVVAEGVETEEQLNFLRDKGCEELQGYLFCRPLGQVAFQNLLSEREKMVNPLAQLM